MSTSPKKQKLEEPEEPAPLVSFASKQPAQTHQMSCPQPPYIDEVRNISVRTPGAGEVIAIRQGSALADAASAISGLWHSFLVGSCTVDELAWWIIRSYHKEKSVHQDLANMTSNQRNWLLPMQLASFNTPEGFGFPLSFPRLEGTSEKYPSWLGVDETRQEMQGSRLVLQPIPQCILGN